MELAKQIDIEQSPVPYSVSKWLYIQTLITPNELDSLFQQIEGLVLALNGSIVAQGEIVVSQQDFLDRYSRYYQGLSTPTVETIPAMALSLDCESLYALEVSEGKFLVKPRLPVVQVREHRFLVTHDGRYQSKGFSSDSIRFGLQFAFPQVFVDPKSNQVVHLLKDGTYPNVALFKQLQSWARRATSPTPMLRKGKLEKCTFRVGKEVLQSLPQLYDLEKFDLSVQGDS